jgi:hypothetical protein
MNRREFHWLSIAAIGAGVLGLVPRVLAKPTRVLAKSNLAKDLVTNSIYRYRVRYARRGNVYRLWMRISDTQNLAADVPVTLAFSTDASGQNVVGREQLVARALDSHIIRKKSIIESGAWQGVTPLFLKLQIGRAEVSSKIYKVWNN